MINYERADPRLLDALTSVVDALIAQTGINSDQIMVVGAGCRDIMHSALGHGFPLRATGDTDIGIAIADWTIIERIDACFPHLGVTGIRYAIAGFPVDIMPFGDVEDPVGITRPRPRGEELVVFGFLDVHQNSHPLTLASGARIRVPTIPGYAVLKLRSWLDRSVYGEDKDAKDLALVAYWYRESRDVSDRLYEQDLNLAILEDTGWDLPLAAAQLLGQDAAKELSPWARQDLAERWAASDVLSFARSFLLPVSIHSNDDISRRYELATRLGQGLATPVN